MANRGRALTEVLVLVVLREGTRMSGAPRVKRLLPKALLALAALALAAVLLAVWSGPAEAATTFTVNKTSDGNDLDFPGGTFDDSSDGKCDTSGKSGNQCTLRAAIQEANETPEADTINFGIPGRRPKVKTINVGSTGNGALPIITDAVTING
jgi:CSLREA domain-containing protein